MPMISGKAVVRWTIDVGVVGGTRVCQCLVELADRAACSCANDLVKWIINQIVSFEAGRALIRLCRQVYSSSLDLIASASIILHLLDVALLDLLVIHIVHIHRQVHLKVVTVSLNILFLDRDAFIDDAKFVLDQVIGTELILRGAIIMHHCIGGLDDLRISDISRLELRRGRRLYLVLSRWLLR